MRFNHLNDWLSWQESLNPAEIDLGLERVSAVLSKTGLATKFNCPLITVAGTNGKGSVVATLEAVALAAGLKVCSYTSPHLFKYNERIKINTEAIDDDSLCAAFARIDAARGDTDLTYFEFGTLAAIDIFHQQQPDLVILEVGLGGRLDAVNIMDSDVSIISSIAIDHVDWLGDNRESIGFEKAGIFRRDQPVICGDENPPASLLAHAKALHCELLLLGRDYHVIQDEKSTGKWTIQTRSQRIEDLPRSALLGSFQCSNVATALMALQSLQNKNRLSKRVKLYDQHFLSQCLQHIRLPGRFQKVNASPAVYVDVAHNPQAASALASQLRLSEVKCQGCTWAIIAMLADKDANGVMQQFSDEIECWCFSGLENISRGRTAQALLESLSENVFVRRVLDMTTATTAEIQHDLTLNQCTILGDTLLLASTVKKACELVLSKAGKADRIIIFGSFYTVAQAMQYFTDLDDHAMRLKN